MRAAWSVVVCLVAGVCGAVRGAEQTWEVRGEFAGLKPGNAAVAVIRLPDGSRLEVPLESLSDSSRAAVEKRTVAKPKPGEGTAAAKPADGKAAKPVVAEPLKNVEADAAACRTAADAVAVYRLFLAADDLAEEDRAAANERLEHWRGLAASGKVRLGTAWVARDAADKAAAEAEKIMTNAFESFRLGNVQLGWEEFQKAERADPESGRASLVMGILQAVRSQDEAKVMESFSEAVRREPDHPAALNNLAVCEVRNRRQAGAVNRFRQSLEHLPDPQPVVDNVAFTIRSASVIRPKMSEKVFGEFNDLYKSFPREWKANPAAATAHILLSPRCRPFAVGSPISDLEEAAAAPVAGLGFVVAPGRMLVSARLVARAREIMVRDPANRQYLYPATVIAAQESPSIALIRCDPLQVSGLPLAEAMPEPDTALAAVARASGAPLALGPTLVRGTVRSAAEEDLDGGNVILAAAVAAGLGGGPLIDGSGAVVGMVAAVPRTDASGGKHSVGIPIERIRPFLAKHLDVPPRDEAAGDAEERALAQTALVTVTKKPAGSAR